MISQLCVLAAVLLVSITLIGCPDKKGPMEKAAERVDEIADNVRDGDPVLHRKGPLEKAGEAIDETFDDRR